MTLIGQEINMHILTLNTKNIYQDKYYYKLLKLSKCLHLISLINMNYI